MVSTIAASGGIEGSLQTIDGMSPAEQLQKVTSYWKDLGFTPGSAPLIRETMDTEGQVALAQKIVGDPLGIKLPALDDPDGCQEGDMVMRRFVDRLKSNDVAIGKASDKLDENEYLIRPVDFLCRCRDDFEGKLNSLSKESIEGMLTDLLV